MIPRCTECGRPVDECACERRGYEDVTELFRCSLGEQVGELLELSEHDDEEGWS